MKKRNKVCHTKFKMALGASLLLACFGYSTLASATCSGVGSYLPLSHPDTLLYSGSPPINVPFAPLTGGTSSGYHGINCDAGGGIAPGVKEKIVYRPVLPALGMILNPGDGKYYRVYQVNSQFGVIVQATDSSGYLVPVTGQQGIDISGPEISATSGTMTTTGGAALVPLVSLSPGSYTIPTTTVSTAKTYVNGAIYPGGDSSSYIRAMTMVIRSKTCSITSPSEVILPDAHSSDFGGVGSLAKVTNTPITINCVAAAANLSLSGVMTDALNPANRSNLLTNGPTDTSNAKIALYRINTGLQLLLGPDSSSMDAQNRFYITDLPASGGVTSIPVIVAYYATAAKTTGGKVTGKATITLIYK